MEEMENRSYRQLYHHYETLLAQKKRENKEIESSKNPSQNDKLGI